MIPNNIKKEHIEKAIQEIDKKGIRKGLHSSTYDLKFNNKLYPPKLVISIANKFATGEELSYKIFNGGKDTPAFELLKKEGFEIIQKTDPIKSLIEKYKTHITTTRLEDEIYKWELVNEFNGRPDTNVLDFYEEVKNINFKNLVYAMGIAVNKQLAKEKPEELRVLFKYLFDESKDLTDRVKFFNKETLKLYRSIGETLQHHQDERSIATYLTYHNSKEYTFYKSSFYSKYCKLLGIKKAKKNEKYIHYLDLINQLIEKYIKPDKELISIVKSIIPDYYDGNNHKLLAQDILYQMLDKKGNLNYWIFQGNLNIYDVVSSLNDNALTTWSVKAHKDKIKNGDKIILWVTGSNQGCYALGEVTSDVYEGIDEEEQMQYYTDSDKNESGNRVKIKITHNLSSNPITKKQIENVAELSELKVGNQGTNFKAGEDEFNALLDIANSSNNNFNSLLNKFNKDEVTIYFRFLDEIIKHFNLLTDDKRLVFSISGNSLNFTVGQRYCFNLYLSNIEGKFGVISSKKLLSESEPFDGTPPQPFYNYYNFFNPNSSEKELIFKAVKLELDRTNKSSFRKFNNTDFENYVFKTNESTKYNNMNFPLNQILYGPPGTGKTYNTVLKAAEIIENRKIQNYSEALKIFNENLGDRIEFITFHQNYSYEDFIQGLRPDVNNSDGLSFERKDGVFKRIATKALNNINASEKAPEEINKTVAFKEALEKFKDFVVDSEDKVYINKVAFISQVEDNAFRYTGDNWTLNDKGFSGFRMKFSDLITFHEKGVRNRQDIKQLTNISGLAKQHASYFIKVYDKVLKYLTEKKVIQNKIKRQNYVIIIDEINRANISRVFGELITLIEPDKRSHGAIPLRATLPSGDEFIVPSNLYIIGTMNTADKSIALLDIALRRRFEFEAMYPIYEIDGEEINDREILERLNNKIIERKGHDFQIGHSYFMNNKNDKYNLVERMNKKVIPLLLEYFMNDDKEVKEILKNAGLSVNDKTWPLKIMES